MEITDINQLDFSKTYSYADYITWKFTEMVELWRGKIMRMAAPNWQHQFVMGKIFKQMDNYLENSPCMVLQAPTDVRIPAQQGDSDDKVFTVVQPDVFILCEGTPRNNINGWVGVPDLVVEIISPSTRKHDLSEKKQIYQSAKIREYWVVFPLEKMLFQFVLNTETEKYEEPLIFAGSDKFNAAIFPDFTLDLHKVFGRLDEWT
jgi:Uma2 family endonuclease